MYFGITCLFVIKYISTWASWSILDVSLFYISILTLPILITLADFFFVGPYIAQNSFISSSYCWLYCTRNIIWNSLNDLYRYFHVVLGTMLIHRYWNKTLPFLDTWCYFVQSNKIILEILFNMLAYFLYPLHSLLSFPTHSSKFVEFIAIIFALYIHAKKCKNTKVTVTVRPPEVPLVATSFAAIHVTASSRLSFRANGKQTINLIKKASKQEYFCCLSQLNFFFA